MRTTRTSSRGVLRYAAACGLILAANLGYGQSSFFQRMWSWTSSVFQDTAQTQAVNSYFGNMGPSINQTIGVGNSLYNIDSHAFSTFKTGMGNDDSATRAALNNFDNTISNDLLNTVLPGRLNDIVPNTEALMGQVQQLSDQLANGWATINNKVSGSIDNLKSYFSNNANAGLEPGSADAAAAQSANVGSPQNILSTVAANYPQTANSVSGAAPASQPGSARTGAPSDEYPEPPPVAPSGPNSERDTDYSSVTAAPVPMQSTDPNSCIRTSNAMGVGSVTINCDSKQPPSDQNDADSSDAAAAAAAAYNASQGVAAAPTPTAVPSPSVRRFTPNPGSSGTASSCAAAAAAHSRCYWDLTMPIHMNESGCQHFLASASCFSQAIPSCGGCSSCIEQLQASRMFALSGARNICADESRVPKF
jgi:hypothetical protein